MRVAFGSLLVSFGPVDPQCRHDTLVPARVRSGTVYDGRKPPRRSSSTLGKVLRNGIDRDSRIRDWAIAAGIEDCPGSSRLRRCGCGGTKSQCTRMAVLQNNESSDIEHAAISMLDLVGGRLFPPLKKLDRLPHPLASKRRSAHLEVRSVLRHHTGIRRLH